MGYKILLADDSVTVQKIITLTFSDEGVDVLTVNNGDEALHRLQYLRPALVMADVSIPGKNGYEICEFVKTHPEMKDTPVVLLVPAFEPFDEERARRIGANQHLTKPFQSIRTLISTVKGLLESNPPKISTPLTNSGPLATTGALTQRAEKVAAQVASENTGKVEAPATVRSYPVQDTQPFPPDQEEEVQPLATEAVIEDVLDIEAEASQPKIEPPKSGPLELEIETIETEAEPQVQAVSDQPEMPEAESDLTPLAEEPSAAEPPIQVEQAAAPAISASPVLTGDLDHVLDLDDVLPEIWPQTITVSPAETTRPVIVEPASDFQAVPSAIPQAVIDEIVNRVVAQLSEKLSGNLAEKLAVQLAPEVAEIVKHQSQHEPAVRPSAPPLSQDSDSLLDLD